MKKQVIQIVSIVATTVAVVSLSACSSQTPAPTKNWQVTQQSVYEDRGYSKGILEANDIQVVNIGETIQIIAPSDRLFGPATANLQSGSRDVLHNIAGLIKTYHTDKIKVAAYTDTTVGNGISQDKAGVALTNSQAQAVSSYLWSQGIDTRYVYSVGYGSADPVATNSTAKGQYHNRRVVISFQYK